MTGIFYVYEHWRPDLDLCFYVGKGQRNRARTFKYRNQIYSAVAAELSRQGMCIEVRMVASALIEAEAFNIEMDRIAFWRAAGVALANRTDGGEGFSGFIRPKGIKLSALARERISAARMGMKFTEEHKQRLAARKQA